MFLLAPGFDGIEEPEIADHFPVAKLRIETSESRVGTTGDRETLIQFTSVGRVCEHTDTDKGSDHG